jgi:hypothetical protein
MSVEPIVIGYWAVIAALSATGALYLARVWWQVRGIRGAALLTALLCAFVVAACFAGLHSHPAPWALFWLAAVERAAWGPLLLALLVLVDLILTAPMVGVVHEMFWRGNGYCPDMPFRMSMGDLAPFPIQWQRNRDKAE